MQAGYRYSNCGASLRNCGLFRGNRVRARLPGIAACSSRRSGRPRPFHKGAVENKALYPIYGRLYFSTRGQRVFAAMQKGNEARLFALGLQLNDKTALYPLRQGVKLLQWRFIVTDTGAIIRKMGKKKQSKQRRKLKKLYAKERRGEYAPGTAHESLVSWLANAARGDTYHERLKMINYFKNMEATYNAREYL